MESFEKECSIRGYHVYKEIWEAAIGEELDCPREPSNAIDRYTVAVMKSGTVVGHLPKKLSRIYSLFLSNTVNCCIRFFNADEGNNADNGPEGSGRLAGLRCCVT